MKLVAITASSLGLWSTLSVANIYLGGGAGKAWLDSDFCDFDTSYCDSDNRSISFFSGYQLNNLISFEVGYNHLGRFGHEDDKNRAQALTLSPRLSLPIVTSEDIFAYGKFGGVVFSSNDQHEFSYFGSIGLEFYTTDSLSFRLEYQRFFNINNFSNSISANNAMLGVSYRFKTDRKEAEYVPSAIDEDIQEVVEKIKHQFPITTYVGRFSIDSVNTEGFDGIIDDVILILEKYPQSVTRVIGHTDSTGSVNYNQRLSEERAKAVANILIKRGISKTRIITEGMGELNPTSTNSTHEGRKENRRVEIVVPEFIYYK